MGVACVELPDVSIPNIFPVTIEPPALPSLDPSFDFCCKVAAFELTIPLPITALTILPPLGYVAAMAVINTTLASIRSVIDALPLDCPKE
jgi:hypothetical protein